MPGGREEFVFKKSFDLSYRNPENASGAWGIKILLRMKLRRDITFHKVSDTTDSWTHRRRKGSKTLNT
jgi:hypothetical protein